MRTLFLVLLAVKNERKTDNQPDDDSISDHNGKRGDMDDEGYACQAW